MITKMKHKMKRIKRIKKNLYRHHFILKGYYILDIDSR